MVFDDFKSVVDTLLHGMFWQRLEANRAISLASNVVRSPIVAALVADVSALLGRAIGFPACVLEWNPLTSWMRQIEDFQRAA